MLEEKLEIIKKACEDKLAQDMEIIKLKNSVIADYFVIVTASNYNQTRAIVDEIEDKLRENGYDSRIEGFREGKWILVDARDIIVHVFLPSAREFYNIEKLWEETE